MPQIDFLSTRPEAQRHAEVALSLAQGVKPIVTLPAPTSPAAPLKPILRAESLPDWLDTPADHCSPLDDY